MTKNRKRILSILLIMVMVFSQMGMVSADTNTDSNYLNPTPELIEFIDEYFENPTQFVVFNKNGENVGNLFYKTNINKYREAKYDNISIDIFQNVSRFSRHLETVISEQNVELRSSSVTKNVSESFYDLIIPADPKQRRIEVQYEISGRITYNANTGVISSCSAASLNFKTFTCYLGRLAIDSVSTNSQIASNKFSATFSANFHITAIVEIPIDDYSVEYVCDYGWQSNSVTGYVE